MNSKQKNGSGTVEAYLHSVRNNGGSDELVGGNLLHELVISLLVKDNLIGQLVLNVTLGPLQHTGRKEGENQR